MSDTVCDLAIRLGTTAKQLTETIFAHPTLGEAVLEAAEGVFVTRRIYLKLASDLIHEQEHCLF